MAGPLTFADTWRLNNRVNLMLLDRLTEEQLAYGTNPRARTIGDQFAHLHNARLMWLEVQAPAAAKELQKIGKGAATRSALREALEASALALGETVAAAEAGGKLKAAKRGPAAFVG